jgi:ubiquinone/menaquinone biosynthesis C-methylase UbiE
VKNEETQPVGADAVSSRYTHGHHESVLRSHRWRTAENSAGYLLDHLRAGASLLDVGCGPGTITLDLAQRVAPGTVVGIDRWQEAVEAARLLLDVRPGLSFETGDLYSMRFADRSFDFVHAHQVLQHLADPVGALGEMARVCRADGLVAVRDGDYASMTWYPEYPELDRWLDLYRRTARANGGEPDAGRRVAAWARAAGCTDIVASASVWCFANPHDRAWWAETWAERITVTQLSARIRELELADQDELEAIGRAWLRWAEEPDGWFSITHGEVLCRPR